MSAVLSLVVAIALVCGRPDMAFGKSFVLSSSVEGRLFDGSDGNPVPDVTIRRSWTWAWTGRKGSEETITDAEGRFRFAEVSGRSLTAGLVPHEPNIRQEIIADLPEGPLTLLSLQKANYNSNGELGDRPLRLYCRTDLEPDARGFFWGTCTYDDR